MATKDVLERVRRLPAWSRANTPYDVNVVLDALAAEVLELRKQHETREARCARNCMGYPAEDVRRWVAAERLEIAEEQIARLKRALVWAVRHGASEGYDAKSDPCIWYSGVPLVSGVAQSHEERIGFDATDESLIATVCRLAEEG